MSVCDYMVCGLAADGQPTSILPFKSAPSQQVVYARTGKLWKPRFPWSQQLEEYERSFSDPSAISGFRLPLKLIEFILSAGRDDLTLEELERGCGSIYRDWESI